MKIAISADCFAAFTSGFPVRGMTLELIKSHPEIEFQLYYTKRPWPLALSEFYEEINTHPNVKVKYFKDSRKIIGLKRLLGMKYVELDADTDIFLNPGCPEYIKGFSGPMICSLADLSTIKGISTNRYARFFKFWTRKQWSHVLPKMAKIVAISDFTRNDLMDYYPSVKNLVTVVHNGIGNNWFESNSDINLNIKFKLNSPYFIWWGFISRRKNINRLIRAYRMAKNMQKNLPMLLLVGKLSDDMASLSNEFGNDIINIPFQDDNTLKSLVQHSNGLIFPSLYEGFGLPVIEAFSQGVNVACSNVTSLPEIADGKAILFDPTSEKSISEAIIQLANKESGDETLIAHAKKFTYRNAATQYMEIINNIVKK